MREYRVEITIAGKKFTAFCRDEKQMRDFGEKVIPALRGRDYGEDVITIMDANLPYTVSADGYPIVPIRVAREFARHFRTGRFITSRKYRFASNTSDYKDFTKACHDLCRRYDIERRGKVELVNYYGNDFRRFVEDCIIQNPHAIITRADEKRMLGMAGIMTD